jgi:hypothetical protein
LLTPEGWTRTFSVAETVKLVEAGGVEWLSLDHDLGSGCPDGQAFTKWLRDKVWDDPKFELPKIMLHTANPVGKNGMRADIAWCLRLIANRKLPGHCGKCGEELDDDADCAMHCSG